MTVVGAAGVVKCAADAGEAPGLVDAQVGDHVGQRKPLPAALTARAVSPTTAALTPKEAALAASTTAARLWPSGLSAERVAEKPLPNSAV